MIDQSSELVCHGRICLYVTSISQYLSTFVGPFSSDVKEILVFKHDVTVRTRFFSSEEEVGELNNEHPEADMYSILAWPGIEEYRFGNEKGFRFKLCYPEIETPDGFEESCNEWYQQSHPYYATDIVGYEPISIPFNEVYDYDESHNIITKKTFGGLGRKVDKRYALVDANPTSPASKNIGVYKGCHFVIGLMQQIDYRTQIPGPPDMGDFNESVEFVALYVVIPKKDTEN